MTRKLLSAFSVAAFGLSFVATVKISAQAAANAQDEEPLQMVIDYGGGKQNHRESHHGVVEPVGLPIGQQVGITLRFLRKRAGDIVTISPLDGGQIDLHGPATIAADGTVAFHFQADNTPGLYRLVIGGAQQYQLSLYAVDPNRALRPSRNPSGR